MLDGRMPATYEALAEWADDLSFRCETRDFPGRDGGRNRMLTVNGTVSAEFAGGSRIVTVEWGGGCRGYFGLGLPLAALTSLIGGLLGVVAEPRAEG